MEADWDELSRIPVPPPSPHALPSVATTVAFDDVMELLWAGNEFVRVHRCLRRLILCGGSLVLTSFFFNLAIGTHYFLLRT